METSISYNNRFQKQLINLFYSAWKLSGYNLNYSRFWFKTLRNQKQAAKLRRENQKENISIPPVMIMSITNRCNLKCKGCYALAQKRNKKKEMPAGRISLLFGEAEELGTRIVMLAGGEPLIREDILRLAAKHKNVIFPVFTNGTLLKDEKLDFFKENKNMIPILSIEGSNHKTDIRRGNGTYEKITDVADTLKKNKQFYGLSITLTKENFEEVTNENFLKSFHNKGCKLFFFVEYVPNNEFEMQKCISPSQKKKLPEILENLRNQQKALYVALPGEEDQYGGCLAAGRGFVHISSTGDLEPCPFAPYSDVNVMDMSLRSALKSSFLNKLRNEHGQLKESIGGCTLWENKNWVLSQLEHKETRVSA